MAFYLHNAIHLFKKRHARNRSLRKRCSLRRIGQCHACQILPSHGSRKQRSQEIRKSKPVKSKLSASDSCFHRLFAYMGGFSLTTWRTRRSYAGRSFLNRLYASAWAGDSGFGSFKRSWIPSRICRIVMAGRQASSSFRIERQTVPEG